MGNFSSKNNMYNFLSNMKVFVLPSLDNFTTLPLRRFFDSEDNNEFLLRYKSFRNIFCYYYHFTLLMIIKPFKKTRGVLGEDFIRKKRELRKKLGN